MDIPEDSQVKYVAYKLRGAASSWWDNLQTGRRRQQKQPIRTWRKMKRVMFARFLPVDYEQTLYSLYQNCRQYSRTVSEYVEEFTRLASRNQLSESDAQQVARFNNGLRYDIQAIICLQTTWTLDEAVRMALKAEHTVSEKTQPLSSNEADTEKNKSTYASHTSNQCRAKAVNVKERGELYEEQSENEECSIRPEDVLDEEEGDEHEAYSYVVRRINQDVVNVIIDGGSSENIISRDIVSRLKLAPQKHPTPYKISWIKTVDIDSCHISLGRPWQCDIGVIHKGKENTYTFSKDEAFLAEVRHPQAIFAVVVKGDNKIMENVPPKLHDLLSEFKNIMPEQIPDGLPPL
ncbi:putative receptor protein kinase ZmPK1 [Tanacetum coccineum]